jgi:CCR4-NOT transcription complex subunit 1
LDDHLSQIIADTSNAARAALATACGAYLAQHCVLVEPCVTHEELRATLDALAAAAPRDSSPVGLARLVERARAAGEKKDPYNASLSSPGQNAGRDASTDPPGLRETVAKLFDEWARVADLPAGDAAIETFLVGLANSELLQNDEQQERFLRILVELAVTHCLGSESAKGGAGAGAGAKAPDGTSLPPLSFVAVDAFTRIVSSLCRRGEDKPLDTRLVLLSRALVAVARTATRDVDERGAAFNPRPYHRALVGLMSEMHAPDTALDASHPQVLSAFAGALLAMRPNRIPGFAFAWLELVSHRCFLPRLLLDHDRQGWPLLRRLLVAALTFLEPFLRQSALTETVRLLYRGTLRLLLVLLHDFPEFLCDHHFDLCDVIPPNCIQMRNLVLSAFPRNMRLPDPFTPNLKVDLLPEISLPPRVISGAECALQLKAPKLRNELDTFLDSRTPSIDVFVENLRERVTLDPRTATARGASYDAPLVNAVVLRCGARGVAAAAAARKGDPKAGGKNPMSNTAPMEVFQKLATDLDPEGRYVFFNAIANQLRFPNSHTHYFSCVLLYLFAECNSEAVREQITRVLLERLIVNRPHPWGLLITFIELIKNPRYAFWDRAFTRCAPDIERLFESVARSCIAPTKPEEDGTVV